MTIPLNVVLVGVAVLAIAAMAGALGAAWYAGRRHAEAALAVPEGEGAAARPGAGAQAGAAGMSVDGSLAPDDATIDRVVRVVSLLFIAAAGVVVALTAEVTHWEAVPVFLLLGIATLFVVFVADLLEGRMERRSRYAVQAVGAVVFLGLLTGFTGGLASPFVIGYFLLVGGAALAWDGAAPIALALASSLTWAFIGLVKLLEDGQTDQVAAQLAWVAFQMASLLLLAYVGTAAGRAQRRARDAALRLSRYDALTGLYNRGAFFASVGREIKRVERSGRGFCLLMLDLDDLKPVNDTFGHPAGDQLLRAITGVVLKTIRASDLAGRYGGDEFVVLLPDTDPEGAFVVAEKLRRDISALAVRVQDRSVRTSVSLGMVSFPDDGRTIEELLSAVDAAMYEAKRRGKNQIVGYTTRTERVATAIGADRPTGPPARARGPRPEESRAEELGLSRPPVREEFERPTGAPPSGPEEAAATPGAPGATAGPAAARIPARRDEDPLDAAAPAYPQARPEEPAVSPQSVAAAPEAVAPGTVATAPPPAGPRQPSMPSLPAQPVRVEPAAPLPAPVRATTPIQPRDSAAAGLPPVPPAGATWSSRSSTHGATPPAPPRPPASRPYVAYPIEGDETQP